MSHSNNRGGLNGRLAGHFAMSAAAAMGVAAMSASAQVVYYTPNWVIPATFDGLYINVETQQTGTSAGSVPGYDMNPWGTSLSGISFLWGTGSAAVRLNTATGGNGSSLSRLPDGFEVGPALVGGASGASFGPGGATFASTTVGFWSYNSLNRFGFRFTSASGGTHYGWATMSVGANAATRTITEIAFESTAGVPIVVGSTGGGGPPPYDSCGAFNPTMQIGSNSLQYRDNAPDLALTGCGGTAFVANYYKFVAPASGTYTFSTCDSGASTRMALLDGCAAGSAQLACSDNECGSSSSISTALTGGQTYYVVIGADSAGSPLTSPIAVRVDSPPNPVCIDAPSAGYGDNAISSTVNAGLNITVFASAAQSSTATSIINNAQFFKFTPTATGAFTIKACLAGDTKLAIGTTCPNVAGTMSTIAFNDDAPTCISSGTAVLGSWIDATNNGATGTFGGFPLTQDLVAGQTYYICVGGYLSTTVVSGNLNISGPEGSPCPADYDGDGSVGGSDLTTLLAAWGTPVGDNDGDGNTSGTDLTVLLAAWGPCAP